MTELQKLKLSVILQFLVSTNDESGITAKFNDENTTVEDLEFSISAIHHFHRPSNLADYVVPTFKTGKTVIEGIIKDIATFEGGNKAIIEVEDGTKHEVSGNFRPGSNGRAFLDCHILDSINSELRFHLRSLPIDRVDRACYLFMLHQKKQEQKIDMLNQKIKKLRKGKKKKR